jgi:hypothetical protein
MSTWRATEDPKIEVEVNEDGCPLRVMVHMRLNVIQADTLATAVQRMALLATATDMSHRVQWKFGVGGAGWQDWPGSSMRNPIFVREVTRTDEGGFGDLISKELIERNIAITKCEKLERTISSLEDQNHEREKRLEALEESLNAEYFSGPLYNALRDEGLVQGHPWSSVDTVERTRWADAVRRARHQ